MPYARTMSARARPLLAACLVVLCGLPAIAQEAALEKKGLGLKLTLQPADFPVWTTLHPAPHLDLTLRWANLSTPAGPVSLFAGRTVGRQAPGMPGLVAPDPELRSASDLMYVGVQFQGGARLRLKRSGDGLKISYRNSF